MSERRAHDAARTTVAGFLVGGGALAVLQLLQQVVGVWDAREPVIVLIAVAVALAAAGAANWRARTQRTSKLAGCLRAWPLPLLDEAGPHLLGVFPPRRAPDPGAGAAEEYVRREGESELAAAIGESPFVLVYGPPRSGKTRTAIQAARAAGLGDAPVLVPCDAEAVDALLDPDLRLDLRDPRVVVWLDGLERFAEALDAEALDGLSGLADEVKLIATIRTDQWEDLLAAPGHAGEAAKAIAARARAFEVPAGEDEIGRVRSTTGMESDPPPPLPAPTADGVRRGETLVWRDAWLAAPGVACVLVVAALGIVIGTGGFEKAVPPPLNDQVAEIRQAATRADPELTADDRYTVLDPKLDLRGGGGDPSRLFVFGDGSDLDAFNGEVFGGVPEEPASDEIRVYDIEDGWLRERFSFQPDATGAQAARVLIRDQVVTGDIDRDGADEFIGAYGVPGEASEAALPFAVDWDEAEGRYRIVSLLPEPPAETERLSSGKLGAFGAVYTRPITLRDSETGTELSGYRVQDFFVDRDPELRLITGHLVQFSNDQNDGVLRLDSYQFRTGAPRVAPCEVAEREILATVLDDGTRSGALERRWEAVSEDRNCGPA